MQCPSSATKKPLLDLWTREHSVLHETSLIHVDPGHVLKHSHSTNRSRWRTAPLDSAFSPWRTSSPWGGRIRGREVWAASSESRHGASSKLKQVAAKSRLRHHCPHRHGRRGRSVGSCWDQKARARSAGERYAPQPPPTTSRAHRNAGSGSHLAPLHTSSKPPLPLTPSSTRPLRLASHFRTPVSSQSLPLASAIHRIDSMSSSMWRRPGSGHSRCRCLCRFCTPTGRG